GRDRHHDGRCRSGTLRAGSAANVAIHYGAMSGKAMGISETFLGRKNVNSNPYIDSIQPPASLPGGEVRIIGRSLKPPQLARPEVSFAGIPGSIVVSSEDFVVARVPPGAQSGQVLVHTNGHVSNSREIKIAEPIAESLHPVANPAVDTEGNVYVTFS